MPKETEESLGLTCPFEAKRCCTALIWSLGGGPAAGRLCISDEKFRVSGKLKEVGKPDKTNGPLLGQRTSLYQIPRTASAAA